MSTVSTPVHNAAAWALRPKTRPFVVSSAPYRPPSACYVAIKVYCVAINPIDWIMQDTDIFGAHYPTVFGSDLAGEVVEIGNGVEGLRVGERVIAHAHNLLPTGHPPHGAFQQYVLVPSISISAIPQSIPFQNAVVLPLSISTASAGLFQQHYLSLPIPTLGSNPSNLSPDSDNQARPRTLIVWGASSSIGSTALQLARASSISSQSSPLTLLAVASAHNFHYCKSLGASQVFDYHSPTIEAELLSAAENTTLAGIFHAAGPESAVRACAHIASRSQGKALVVTVRPPPQDKMPSDVRIQAIKSTDIFKPGNEVGSRIWRDFVPGALARGLLVPAPEAVVVGSGLRSIQKGLDVQKRGVSARKVVVEGIERDASKEDEGGWEVEKARRVRSELYV